MPQLEEKLKKRVGSDMLIGNILTDTKHQERM